MTDNGTLISKPQTLSEFEELLEKTNALKKSLRMVSKMTNSEKILKLGERLGEILPVLPGTIEDLKARALASEGEDRKRYAHLGVQFLSLEKDLKKKQPQIAASLERLSGEEAEFLGLDTKQDGDQGEDGPAGEGEEVSEETSDTEQQEG